MAIDGGFRLSWGYPQIIQVTKDNGNTILGLKPMVTWGSPVKKNVCRAWSIHLELICRKWQPASEMWSDL